MASATAAPATIRDTYEEAYGYRVGDLRGLMSIKLPMDEVRARAGEGLVATVRPA